MLTKDEIAELARQADLHSKTSLTKAATALTLMRFANSVTALVKPEEATRREEINGVQGNDQEQESVPAVEPSSEQSLPSLTQPIPASLLNSGIPLYNQWENSADIAWQSRMSPFETS